MPNFSFFGGYLIFSMNMTNWVFLFHGPGLLSPEDYIHKNPWLRQIFGEKTFRCSSFLARNGAV